MHFSLGLPFASGEQDSREYDDLVALAVHADRLGIEAVSTTDHPFPVVAPGEPGHHALDPFVLLSFIASTTERIKLHFSLVVAGYRNPYLLARMISSLDVLSHGRTITALGAGYMEAEFSALGATFESRGGLLDRQLAAMQSAWSGEPVYAPEGDWPATGNVMRPRPPQSPRPRLWRGGNSMTAMRSAVARFDGWTPFEVARENSRQTATSAMTTASLPGRLTQLRQHRAEVERSGSFEVCFVRTGTRWLRDGIKAAEELQELQAAGLDWLELKVPGRSLDERTDSLSRFVEIANDCGVRAQPTV